MSIDLSQRIYVAGHEGLVGSAIVRALYRAGATDIVTRTHAELDLRDQTSVRAFFSAESIDQVYLAAATVGGIHANQTFPAKFIHSNLTIQTNVIHEAWRHGVERLLFLGSSCIYPRLAPQPIPEDALLTGSLEPTNEPYAVAKIAGIKMCESYNRQFGTSFRSVMPTNLYGPGDNYHAQNSHVIPALLQRFEAAATESAPEVAVWGTGKALREFLYVDDLAEACLYVMGMSDDAWRTAVRPTCSHINVGYGSDLTIAELAHILADVVGFEGRIVFDPTKPDGTPRKLLDSTKIRGLGWRPQVPLHQGLRETYHSYRRSRAQALRLAPARALDLPSVLRRQAYAMGVARHAYSDMRSPS